MKVNLYTDLTDSELENRSFTPGSIYITDTYRVWLDPINGNMRVPLNCENASDGAFIPSADAAVLASADGTNTTKLFEYWWPKRDTSKSNYENLSKWFDLIASTWVDKRYTLRYYQPSVSASNEMTPMDDLADGRASGALHTDADAHDTLDWTEEDPMCWYVRGNALSLADGTMDILALEGDSAFDITGETAPVYTFAMALYRKRWSDDNYKYISWATTNASGYRPYAGDVGLDNKKRSMTWHATFDGGVTSTGKLTSGAGLKANFDKSAMDGLTEARMWSNNESIYTDCDLEWLIDMWQLRHWNLENSNILEGCTNYYHHNIPLVVAETGVKRAVISATNAENFIVGSTVGIGSGSDNMGYTVVDRAVILSKEAVGDNVAINLDVTDTFDTTTSLYLNTYPWHSGSTECVAGHVDGCRGSLTSGQYPARIAGIEVLNGAGPLGIDPIYMVTPNDDYSEITINIYEAKNCSNIDFNASDLSDAGFADTGIVKTATQETAFGIVKSFIENDKGVVMVNELDTAMASFNDYYKSVFGLEDAGLFVPYRFGFLDYSGVAGLAYGGVGFTPGDSYWGAVPRLAGSGKKRGEWQE